MHTLLRIYKTSQNKQYYEFGKHIVRKQNGVLSRVLVLPQL